jgi:hypothetical protein
MPARQKHQPKLVKDYTLRVPQLHRISQGAIGEATRVYGIAPGAAIGGCHPPHPASTIAAARKVSHPIDARIADIDATQELWGVRWINGGDWVARAAVHLELALQRLKQNEFPLAVAHLYMGVEAITSDNKGSQRFQCSSRSPSERSSA